MSAGTYDGSTYGYPPSRPGRLPFLETASLQRQGGEEVREVSISVWSIPDGRVTDAGVAYDHSAQVPLEAWDDLAGPEADSNLSLVLEGPPRRFKIVGSARMTILPHVELRLREMDQGG